MCVGGRGGGGRGKCVCVSVFVCISACMHAGVFTKQCSPTLWKSQLNEKTKNTYFFHLFGKFADQVPVICCYEDGLGANALDLFLDLFHHSLVIWVTHFIGGCAELASVSYALSSRKHGWRAFDVVTGIFLGRK